MKKLLLIIAIVLFAFPAWALQSVPFTNAGISTYGRYVTDGVGTALTAPGTWMRFTISGTTTLKLNVQVNLLTGAAGALLVYDNYTLILQTNVTVPATNQDQTITISTTLTTGNHNIMVQYGEYIGHNALDANGEYIKIKNIVIGYILSVICFRKMKINNE